MRTIYFETLSGISGDMSIAALLDLGVDKDHLLEQLSKLNVPDYEIEISRSSKQGIGGIRFEVITKEQKKARNLSDILEIINGSDLNQDVKEMSSDIFRIIARAEAKIHDMDIDKIHFHEIGAIDSIVDIVGLSICVDYLKPDRILASSVNVGKGHIKCDHGIIPIPAPATMEILMGVPVYSNDQVGELVTPTGAAILKQLADGFVDIENMKIDKIGYGLGKKDFKHANVLRVFMSDEDVIDEVFVIETNIDDMNPELYGQIFDDLYELGALEVYLQPVIMKKQRPGNILSVICKREHKSDLEDKILRSTTTFGVRSYKASRKILDRKIESIETIYGKVNIKKGYLNNKLIKSKPEYEDIKKISKDKNVAVQDILDEISKNKENPLE